ncbi:sensor histidine kinase [Amycolatopsis orientalis]|uniref:sensor histidine kinase n=1 Tax=Amycolatopsis orientalis TaxID=31958 RepID=UPI001F3E86AF|nr:sensor histidine kinase [Amycolatopsis orientalis]
MSPLGREAVPGGAPEHRFGLKDRASWWEDPPARPGRGPHRVGWPIFAAGFLLPYLIPATRGLIQDPGPLWIRILLFALIAVYALCYVVFPVVFGKPRPVRFWFGGVMLALGLLCALIAGASPYILLYATATLAFLFPAAWSLIFNGTALSVLVLVLWLRGDLAEHVSDVITVVSVTSAMFFMSNLIRVIRRLELANQEIGTLAVANERERVARDLHDLLGHSLTTITVKAGLARRVLESSGDLDRAVQEIREVEGLTRSALSDVRATVSEYREVSLPAEIAGARAALRAAEVEADLPHAVDNVRTELQSTFGYVLREAITNVLRHSGAKQVKVRLGRDWLEIEDNGRAAGDVVPGNGLRGLSERLAAIGGTLTTRTRPGGGWVVRAEVPEPKPDGSAVAVRAEPAGGLA